MIERSFREMGEVPKDCDDASTHPASCGARGGGSGCTGRYAERFEEGSPDYSTGLSDWAFQRYEQIV